MTTSTTYPSDLTDAQWAILAPLLPDPRSTGRPRTVDPRAVMNAIFYQLRTGCQWRYLPTSYPKWQTVYWYFAMWTDSGVFRRLNDELRRRLRVHVGRNPDPTAASIDSQSVKTTEKGGATVMTAAKRSMAGSDTYVLIRKACCWR